jgi:RHS repeat-associated protein
MRWHWVMVSMAILFLVPMGSAEGAEKVTASGERYVVVLAEEVAETEAASLASVYGGVIEPDGGHGGRQFVVRMASSRARMMSLDPHVVSVSEQSRHLTPLPTGSGSTTLGPYAYDGSGTIRSIGPAGNQEQYIYDALGRLTSATAGVTNTQTYQYDPFGNRTVVTRTGSNCTGDTACEQQGTYLAETNHLNNNGAVYDAAGNLTAYVADQYVYDASGMLARASVSGDRQYLYTAFDERIAVYDGTFNWRWMVRSEDGKVLREFTSTNDPSTGALGVASRQWVKDYVWRNGQLLATENRNAGGGTVTEHYHLDHLGTPRLVTDETGLKLATHTYYAFGAELMGTPESPEAGMKFTGHERDITGTSDALDNMHARYYSSLTGRFLSVDPEMDIQAAMSWPEKWNHYAYADNNPIKNLDANGRETVVFIVGPGSGSQERGGHAAVWVERNGQHAGISKGGFDLEKHGWKAFLGHYAGEGREVHAYVLKTSAESESAMIKFVKNEGPSAGTSDEHSIATCGLSENCAKAVVNTLQAGGVLPTNTDPSAVYGMNSPFVLKGALDSGVLKPAVEQHIDFVPPPPKENWFTRVWNRITQ